MGIQARGSGRSSPQRQWHTPAHLSLPSHQGLTKLLSDNAPGCMKEVKFDSYFGRKVAIDASMHIYQFMARCRFVALALAPRPSDRRLWTPPRPLWADKVTRS